MFSYVEQFLFHTASLDDEYASIDTSDVQPPLNVEEFMRLFLEEQALTMKWRLEVHKEYWQRFFLPDVRFDSRSNSLSEVESEKVVEISAHPANRIVHAITRANSRGHRYHLEYADENWIIQRIDLRCPVCAATVSKRNCDYCSGLGWMSQKEMGKFLAAKPARKLAWKTSASENSCDPSAELFIDQMLAERTASRNAESKLEAELARRFFGPEVLWRNRLAGDGASESILECSTAPSGVYVITSGFHDIRHRYHLVRLGASWIIADADLECVICRRTGQSSDCRLCRGTIWKQGKA